VEIPRPGPTGVPMVDMQWDGFFRYLMFVNRRDVIGEIKQKRIIL